MALVVSLSGRRGLLGAALPYLRTLYLRLYASNHVPLPTDTQADFVEPVFDSYAPAKLSTWSPPYLNPQLNAQTDGPVVVFTVGPAGGIDRVFGYWITDVNGNFIMAELFASGPVDMILPGATCPVTLRFLSGALC